MTKLRIVVSIASCWCLIFVLMLYSFSQDSSHKGRNGVSSTEKWSQLTSALERTNIFFLKTHKCASSTVQNILMRFGYRRHLDFVLPMTANYLGHPARFNRTMLTPALVSPSRTYNIFTHHSRYNYEEVKAVMKEGAAFVTILREPVDHFESLYQFYHLEHVTKLSLPQVLQSPNAWQALATRPNTTRRMGSNQMSYDLGLDPLHHDYLDDFIISLDEQFDLVMLAEHMEASLVLLCQLMNWPLEHVVSFKMNSRQSARKIKLNATNHAGIATMNYIDVRLYNYFSAKFKRRIIDFGVNKMKHAVKKLLDLNSKLWSNCVVQTNSKGYAQTLGYDLRNAQDFVCYYAARDELKFTEEIRNDQIRRFAALKKLDLLFEKQRTPS